MEALSLTQRVLPTTWTQVLDHVHDALAKAEAEAAQHERTLAAEATAPETEAEHGAPWREGLVRLEERLQGWQTVLRHAETTAAEAEETFRAGEEELRRWLSEAAIVQQRLADWANRAV
jgi:hypothetical protein